VVQSRMEILARGGYQGVESGGVDLDGLAWRVERWVDEILGVVAGVLRGELEVSLEEWWLCHWGEVEAGCRGAGEIEVVFAIWMDSSVWALAWRRV
jgi:hypothetical protein